MDSNIPNFNTSRTAQEDAPNLEKLTQSYLSLKKRISGTHEVIKQYNDKLKECERLKQDLDVSNKQIKAVTCDYNSTLAKVIKLELQSTEYKKSIESLTTQVNEYQIKIAADQQHIQQLICKIKDVEGNQNDKIMQYDLEKSSLQVKVKELEQELKTVKKSHDMKMKKLEKKLPVENENKPKTRNIGTNTMLIKDVVIKKPEVAEKCILTDEFFKVKDDVYPIFCAKCEVALEPPPLEKICKIMANSCPKLIEKISSPSKKSSYPLQVSTDINNEQCKTECLPTLSDTPPLLIPNENNHANFITTNLLPPHTISLNRTDYCNTFPPESSLMNPNTFYIRSTPMNSLEMANTSAANQNNHCESIATMASSLSIISSMQKRIDTLEMKIKKKLNKRKSEESNSCCQHHRPNACCRYDMNNSMQFNFMELWKRMTDFYERKEKKNFDIRGRSRKHDLSRLRIKKRLQNSSIGSWRVESVAKRMVDHSPPRKKPKKRKYCSSELCNKSNTSLNSIEDLEKSINDSDEGSSLDTFNYTDVNRTDVNLESKNSSHVETSISSSNTNMNETEVAELVKGSIEYGKSVGGETDSGILSDSVESGKMTQLETDMNGYSDLTEQRNTTEMKTSMRNESCINANIKSAKSPIKVASHLMKSNEIMEKHTTPETTVEPNEHKNVEEMSQSNDLASDINICTFGTPSDSRKRKRSELQDLKRANNRQKLLKKLKNLRKSSKVVNICQKVLGYEDVQSYDCGNINNTQEQKVCNTETVAEDHYIPKKKPRIAHTPRSSITEQKISLSNISECKKRIIESAENTNIQKDSADLTKSKEDTRELEETCSNRIEEPEATFLDMVNSPSKDAQENINEILIPEIREPLNQLESRNSLDIDMNNYDHSYSKSNVNYSLEETVEAHETKTELNTKHRSEGDKMIQELNPEERHFNNTVETNETSETILQTEDATTNACIKEENLNKEDRLKSHCLLVRLQQYVKKNKYPNKSCKSQYKKLLHARLAADKFVKKQLQRLMDSEWEASVHWSVIEKLKSTCTARIIAKGIVEFLSTEEDYNKHLDKSHTPPAPLMTKAQQRIAALLVDLEESKPTVFQFVYAGIEYKLFRLNQTTEKYIIESLARMHTVLARIQKDRERVRIFCCDALYCLGLNAIIILYTVFTCWPEVFPNNETDSKLLPKCMAHLIMAQQATDFPKLFALKNLVSVFYKYQTGTLSKDILKELLTALQICPVEKSYSEIETAVILLAKQEGTTWTYKNIIRGALLPMIVNNKLPSTYRAFYLLGNLMRAFPIEDKDNSVGEIVEQLCDLINSGEGSDEQKEGVISALLSLSRHKFDEVLKNTLKWTPSAPLHEQTIKQLNGLINLRPMEFWRSYLKKNRLLLGSQKN